MILVAKLTILILTYNRVDTFSSSSAYQNILPRLQLKSSLEQIKRY
jgi:hypothetical protein